MHELNQAFLPPKKQYRVTGVPPAGSDPYRQVDSASSISGRFQFDFKANALNTSKAAQSQILQQMMGALANGMTLQMGLTDKEHIYNLLHDWIVSLGQNDTRYLIAPPESNIPKITAEEALGQIALGQMPQGKPAEGIQDHLATIQNFMTDPRMSQLAQADPAFYPILHAYLQQVQGLLQQQQMQAQQAQMFAQAQGGGGGGQPGPTGQPDAGAQDMGMQGPGQVNDESLPGAKGLM